MANWSDTSVQFSGTKENIDKAEKLIATDTTPDGQFLTPTKFEEDNSFGYNSMELHEAVRESDTSLIINGAGRWAGPEAYFAYIAKQCKLSGEYIDRENGCDFFFKFEFTDGEITKKVEDDYFSDGAITEFGIDQFVEEYAYTIEEEDWKTENDGMLALFAKHGYTVDALEKAWKEYNGL